ncbi:DNA polymerase III subunits gamma and tau [Candidatus Velamenicoccus archaeovorus]|uniref:DNA polymerase III subunit gamma/tau n=1 Tax=Velamenicoccus archaeovorus TaxID=1930593 RepID=A0A410P5D7_VELA1|nr:DNA polymerase III subunit gamma/tau [Candidatus Velamenicoccus archaeovorus]QAT17399.1 DNA polymerase III subunits gamma and tau [Candidatus Velamenicoccus archaeovorus]
MSYLVFARKWRPKNFDEVIGQDHITKTLKSAIQSNKLAHAYLFSGPQGVGKTSCARILAKALNCQQGPTQHPCGVCPACQEIAEGRSLDVIEIDGASNRGIDEIRSLRENVKFAPLNGKFKVYIIDEVHMLTPEAFNALLKTLEEPPSFVTFIFATTQPQKVLPTILSRCQRFDFVRIPNLKVIEKLKEIAADEKLPIGEDVFLAIAKAANGCMRDAESILDQLIAFSQKDIKLEDVISILGIIEEDVFLKFVDACRAGDAPTALRLIAEISAKGKDMNYFLDGLLEHYRNLMVAKIMKEGREELVDLPAELIAQISSQAQRMELADIMVAINQIFAAQEMSRKLSTTRIPLEILAVKLAGGSAKKEQPLPRPVKENAGPSVVKAAAPPVKKPLSVLREERGSADNRLSSFVPPEKSVGLHLQSSSMEAGEVSSEKSCSLQDVQNSWDRLIRHLAGVKMSVSTYLREASPVRCEDGLLTIGFPRTAVFFKETLEHKDNLKVLEEAIASVCGARLRLKLDIVQGLAPAAKEEAHFEETPFFKSAMDLFKGKVVGK